MNLTYRQWGALIGFIVVFSAGLIGIGVTAIAILFGIVGYLIGRFLEGDLDLSQIQQRAQGRSQQQRR